MELFLACGKNKILYFLLVIDSIHIIYQVYNNFLPQIIFLWILLQKIIYEYICPLPSTDGCQTEIYVFHPDGNFNQYELVCFGIRVGYIQNHSTLLSNVYL